MRVSWLIAAFAALLLLQDGAPVRAAAPAEPSLGIVRLLDVGVPMRDGVRLSANVFLPANRGRVPVILERTPYGKSDDPSSLYRDFVRRGYAVVAQDVRGRYKSEGVFRPLHQEGPDGYDTLTWIARQPWCDGKIGMIGGSYRGIAQWKVAVLNHPNLKAMFPVVSGWDDYTDRFYSAGGAMKLGGRLEWMAENLKIPGFRPDFAKFILHIPLRSADVAATGARSEMWQEAIEHPERDAFWRSMSVQERIRDVRVPVFSVGGWYDNYAESDLEAFAALQRTGRSRILIGAWAHNMIYRFADADFGQDWQIPIRALQFDWFDRWLMGKKNTGAAQPPAKVFVMGANRWREDASWPPPGARPKAFYLSSGGHAQTLDGDGALIEEGSPRTRADHFAYDPRDPVPTRGGAVCCNPRVFPWGPMDQRPVERRPDVLVYTSEPMESDLEVVGPVTAVLYVSTSAPDTDFTAKLVDVFPDGNARNLSDGILRMRYREGLDRAEPVNPGHVYRIAVDAGATANVFRKGHRIRLEVSSSNFPRFDRNPNTGGRIAEETRSVVANQTVYHDRERLSQLVLMAMEARPQRSAANRTR